MLCNMLNCLANDNSTGLANIFPRLNKQIIDLKYTIPLARYAKLTAGTHAMKPLYRTVYTHTREKIIIKRQTPFINYNV